MDGLEYEERSLSSLLSEEDESSINSEIKSAKRNVSPVKMSKKLETFCRNWVTFQEFKNWISKYIEKDGMGNSGHSIKSMGSSGRKFHFQK